MKTRSLFPGLIFLLIFSFQSLSAATIFCPCDPPPYPGMVKTKISYMLPGGDIVKVTCTNESATGDFVYVYCPAGGGKSKPIGRCIYTKGKNSSHYSNGYFLHIVRDSFCNKKARLDVFCIAQCKKWEFDLEYNPTKNKWEESSRKCRDSTYFANLSTVDLNNDGVSDAGFYDLTEDIYPFPPPPLPADYTTLISLDLESDNTNLNVLWNSGNLNPLLESGDHILLEGLSVANINALNPNFSASNETNNLKLTCVNAFSPQTGDVIVTLQQMLGQTVIPYTVIDPTATPFFGQVFSLDSIGLDSICWSNNTDFSDLPGYISTNGVLIPSTIIPTLSQWGLILLTLLLLTLSSVAILRQRFVLAGSKGGNTLVTIRQNLPYFESRLYWKILPKVLLLVPAVLLLLYLVYGLITITDVFGTLLGAGIVAYLIYFIVLSSNLSPNDNRLS